MVKSQHKSRVDRAAASPVSMVLALACGVMMMATEPAHSQDVGTMEEEMLWIRAVHSPSLLTISYEQSCGVWEIGGEDRKGGETGTRNIPMPLISRLFSSTKSASDDHPMRSPPAAKREPTPSLVANNHRRDIISIAVVQKRRIC